MDNVILRSEWLIHDLATPEEDRLHCQGYDSQDVGDPSTPQEYYEDEIAFLKSLTGERKFQKRSSHYWFLQLPKAYMSNRAIFRKCIRCGAKKFEYCHYLDVAARTGRIVSTTYPHVERRRYGD